MSVTSFAIIASLSVLCIYQMLCLHWASEANKDLEEENAGLLHENAVLRHYIRDHE
jgi:hypothetical protein